MYGAQAAVVEPAKEAKIEVNEDQFAAVKHITQDIEVNTGDTIMIELVANSTTGFQWDEPVISDNTLVEFVKSEYVAPADGMLGAGGNQTVNLKALKAGHSTITMQYSRPWEGGEKGEWSFVLNITIR